VKKKQWSKSKIDDCAKTKYLFMAEGVDAKTLLDQGPAKVNVQCSKPKMPEWQTFMMFKLPNSFNV